MPASKRVMVGRVDEIQPLGMKRVIVDGSKLLVVFCDGAFFTVDDTCTHEESSLSEGYLSGCEIECSLHGAKFDVKTGEVRALPAVMPLQTYPTDVVNGEIFVQL